MKILTPAQKKSKYFNSIRVLAIVSLTLAIVFALVILIEGAMSGETSAKQSDFLSKIILSVLRREESSPVGTAGVSISAENRFAGETAPLSVEFLPSTATDRAVSYFSDNENVATVSRDGTVTYVGFGKTTIVATLDSNNDIRCGTTVTCYGTNPRDITQFKVEKSSFKMGARSSIKIFDQNGSRIKTSVFDIVSDNENVLKIDGSSTLAIGEGVANVTFSYPDENFSQTVKYTVTANPKFAIPQSFGFSVPVLEAQIGDTVDLDELLTTVIPAGAATLYSAKIKFTQNSEILVWQSANKYSVEKSGQAVITVTSCFNRDCSATLTVNVPEPLPSRIRVIEPGVRLVKGNSYALHALGDTDIVRNVTWEVIRGRAAISADGVLSSKSMGKVTVRVTSNLNPSVYADIQLRFAYFPNFKSMVRTMVGHFGLFALFGLTFAAFIFLTVKPRGCYPLIGTAVSFAIAVLSELLQLPGVNTSRYASWTDVLIDSLGALLGIAITSAGILLYTVIKKKTRSEEFALLRSVFTNIQGKTALCRNRELLATDNSIYVRIPKD